MPAEALRVRVRHAVSIGVAHAGRATAVGPRLRCHARDANALPVNRLPSIEVDEPGLRVLDRIVVDAVMDLRVLEPTPDGCR
jgi:hypothetical protein